MQGVREVRNIFAEVVEIKGLKESETVELYKLMEEFYDDICFDVFKNDLIEKNWTVLLRKSANDEIVGFSTIMIIKVRVDGKDVFGAFSGDTIVHKDYWNQSDAIRACMKFLVESSKNYDGGLYWFLICKGYRTYRFLPTFMNEFYPRYDAETPAYEKSIIDAFGMYKYPFEYSAKTGVVHYKTIKDKLKPSLGGVDAARLKDPHINFFMNANPGCVNGDDIVCITKLDSDNLNKLGKRLVCGN